MGTTGDLITFAATATSRADRQSVLDVLRDLPAHLEWAGTRSPQKTFRLLSLDAPAGPASVGTRFSSTGANMNGTFHDTSVVTVAQPYTFAFETASRLERRHGAELLVHFAHRYEVEPDGAGSRIVYSCRAHDGNYVPYRLKPGLRAMTRSMINRSMTKQLHLLAQLAEDRATAPAVD
ncbi:MAG TPA: SRPBCC family protein [Mycobacterium sp.]